MLADGPDDALEAFTTFTHSDRYATTNEAVVYGGQPEFDRAFDTASPERWQSTLDFYERFLALADIPWDKSKRVYVYAPDTP